MERVAKAFLLLLEPALAPWMLRALGVMQAPMPLLALALLLLRVPPRWMPLLWARVLAPMPRLPPLLVRAAPP